MMKKKSTKKKVSMYGAKKSAPKSVKMKERKVYSRMKKK